MKKFYGESWFAKLILLKNYLAITLGPVAFSKSTFIQKHKNHECTHMRQWAEVAILSYIVLTVIMICTNISPWFLLLPLIVYYVLYILEWLIRLQFNGIDAYRHLSFEREAYNNEHDDCYNTNCGYFGWLAYVFKK